MHYPEESRNSVEIIRGKEKPGRLKSILLIDIPEMEELADSEMRKIVEDKWSAEDRVLGDKYSKHMNGQKYSRGLLTIASSLREAGIEVDYITIDEMKSDEAQFADIVQKHDAVGIEANVTPFFPHVVRISEKVKDIKPKSKVIVGGSHVTFTDVDTLGSTKTIDIVVRGEGEETLVNVMYAYPSLEKVMGITYKDMNGDIIRNKNASLLSSEKIPSPSYDLLKGDPNRYSYRLQSSRGCSFNCDFCEDPEFWRRRTRAMPKEKMLGEQKLLRERLDGSHHLHFIDSIFTLNRERTIDNLNSIRENNFGFNYSADIRAGFVDEELVDLMQKTGFTVLLIGLEDPNQSVLDTVEKGIEFEKVLKTVEVIKKNSDIKVVGYWMIGLPGSTHQTLHNAVNTSRQLLREDVLDLVYSGIYVPVPGTKIFNNPQDYGMKIVDKDWSQYLRTGLKPVYELENLPREEIYNYHLMFESSNLMEIYNKLGVNTNDISDDL